MVRISESGSTEETIHLRLEGQVIGQGVVEVQKICEHLLAMDHKLALDLAEVVFVDRTGVTLLQDLARRQVVLLNCTPFLAEQLKDTNSEVR